MHRYQNLYKDYASKDTVYAWESQQQEAFEAIKPVITKAPVLAYFDKNKKHYIQTDASKKGLGAVLLQDGQPVVYVSRSLTPAETQYSNIERELLAVVFALERLSSLCLWIHSYSGNRSQTTSFHLAQNNSSNKSPPTEITSKISTV